ncbi:hypothetical protein POTOM_029773 [Populus tomentosa]|uniref:Uncharacterized protein n=1 Tax=Populus tomentosa TaxID=118781 RepID=A0A8X7ZBM0_POPTO|nr:hypothetical protein POTOM_029773 [Populus tomentosa]
MYSAKTGYRGALEAVNPNLGAIVKGAWRRPWNSKSLQKSIAGTKITTEAWRRRSDRLWNYSISLSSSTRVKRCCDVVAGRSEDTADKYLIMMKILLALLLAFLLMLASLQADAEVLSTTMIPKVANRHLLSKPSSLGRKGNAGENDAKTPTSNKGNSNTESKTASDDDDDDETNRDLGGYGGGYSSAQTHHHYTNGTRPPKN